MKLTLRSQAVDGKARPLLDLDWNVQAVTIADMERITGRCLCRSRTAVPQVQRFG